MLNGHIHQVLQKVEGNVELHTAMSLAYPLPTPGQAGIGEPGPVTVPAGELGKLLGTRASPSCRGGRTLALVDTSLDRLNQEPSHAIDPLSIWNPDAARRRRPLLALGAAAALPTLSAARGRAGVDRTRGHHPVHLRAQGAHGRAGHRVVWTNKDETPHTVTSNDKRFASKGLDTDDRYEHTFAARATSTTSARCTRS